MLNNRIKLIRQVLEDMEMLSAFTAVLHVPNMSRPEHIVSVLEVTDSFTKGEIAQIAHHLQGRKYVTPPTEPFPLLISLASFSRVFIGMKKLLALIDLSKQAPEGHRVIKFLTKLEEDGGLENSDVC